MSQENGKKPLFVRIDSDILRRIKAKADEIGRPLNAHVERIFVQYLAKVKG